jgi:hypothetical protein
MKTVICPTCSVLVNWNDQNPFRPFCSQRCKMVDFGNWANESYCVTHEIENFQNIKSDLDNNFE